MITICDAPKIIQKQIVQNGDCLEWNGYLDGKGYPRMQCDGKMHGVHRIVCALDGRDPFGKVVMHTCDNPICVNPKHLVVGTQIENIADMHSKGRHAFGERNNSKLTESEVLAMRKEYDAGGIGYILLGRKYGVNCETTKRIVKRINWKHLP